MVVFPDGSRETAENRLRRDGARRVRGTEAADGAAKLGAPRRRRRRAKNRRRRGNDRISEDRTVDRRVVRVAEVGERRRAERGDGVAAALRPGVRGERARGGDDTVESFHQTRARTLPRIGTLVGTPRGVCGEREVGEPRRRRARPEVSGPAVGVVRKPPWARHASPRGHR